MKTLILFIVVFITGINAFAQSKESIYQRIVEKYGNINSFSTNFQMAENPHIIGELTAARGNKYIMTLGNRTITGNGEFIWNFSRRDNNVIISKYDESDPETVSIEQFFFDFLKTYRPTDLRNETVSTGQKSYLLTIQPSTPDKAIANVMSVEIWIDYIVFDITRIAITNNGMREEWILSNLSTNINMAPESFTFSIPESAQVIDLR